MADDDVSTDQAESEATASPTPLVTSSMVAAQVIEKLRGFIETLDPPERALLAALLAPGVASAFVDEPEVVGFTADDGTTDWAPMRLPEALAEQLRIQDFTIRVEPR